jgi:hypothetical protein
VTDGTAVALLLQTDPKGNRKYIGHPNMADLETVADSMVSAVRARTASQLLDGMLNITIAAFKDPASKSDLTSNSCISKPCIDLLITTFDISTLKIKSKY